MQRLLRLMCHMVCGVLLCSTINLALIQSAEANPGIAESVRFSLRGLFKGRTGKLFLKTKQGKDLRQLLKAKKLPYRTPDDVAESLTRKNTLKLGQQIEDRLKTIKNLVDQQTDSLSYHLRGAQHAQEEEFLVRFLSERYVTLQNKSLIMRWLSRSPKKAKLNVEGPAEYFHNTRKFLQDAKPPTNRVKQFIGDIPPPARSSRLIDGQLGHIKNLFKDMRQCIKNQPKGDRWKSLAGFIGTDIFISRTVSTGFYILGKGLEELNHSDTEILDFSEDNVWDLAAKGGLIIETGVKKIDYPELTLDLVMGSVFGGLGSYSMGFVRGSVLFVKWLNLTAVGLTGAKTYSFFYVLDPFGINDETPKEVRQAKADKYLEFNAKWQLFASTWRHALIYEVSLGMLCLSQSGLPQYAHLNPSRIKGYSFWGRLANAGLANLGYFYLRASEMREVDDQIETGIDLPEDGLKPDFFTLPTHF